MGRHLSRAVTSVRWRIRDIGVTGRWPCAEPGVLGHPYCDDGWRDGRPLSSLDRPLAVRGAIRSAAALMIVANLEADT